MGYGSADGLISADAERSTGDQPVGVVRLGKATVLLPVLTLVLMVLRAPDLVLHPRMWFEEITWFYPLLAGKGLRHAITLIYRDNYQLLTNAVVYVATLVPVEHAAYVTAAAALCVQTVAAFYLGLIVEGYGLRRWLILPLACIWAFLPQGYEVFATTTNIQWVCSISMLFVFTAPLSRLGRFGRASLYLWALMCGLTGVPSCMLFWAFLARAWWTGDRRSPHLIVGCLLFACTLLQGFIILTHPTPDARHFGFHPGTLLLPGLLQTALSPLLGIDLTEAVAVRIKIDPVQKPAMIFEVLLVAATAFFLAARLAWDGVAGRATCVTICLIWIALTLLNTFGSIGEPYLLISGLHNGRYYLAGVMCFVLLVVLATGSPNRTARQLATYLVCFFAILCTGEVILSPWNWLLFKFGPSWQSLVQSCHDVRPCTLSVFGDWKVTLTN